MADTRALLIVVASALSACSYSRQPIVEEIDYAGQQNKAAILVSDPQVYSRASLINDRRQESQYLQTLLANSRIDSQGKSVVNFSPQIVRDLRTVEALSANFGLSIAKNTANADAAMDLSRQIETAKLQAQLAVLQKQIEGINAATAPQVTVPAPDLSAAAQTGTSGTAAPSVTPPDVTKLQAAIKAIQAQLKDLASTQLSVTPPSTNYSALFDPRDDFVDRQAFRRDIRAALAEAQLDDVHDRAGNALYRLQFQATVLPPSGKSRQWGAARMVMSAPEFSYADLSAQYQNWLIYLSGKLNESTRARYSDTGNPVYDSSGYVTRLARAGYFDVVDLFVDKAYGDHYCYVRVNPEDDLALTSRSYAWALAEYRLEATYAVPKSIGKACDPYPRTGAALQFTSPLTPEVYSRLRQADATAPRAGAVGAEEFLRPVLADLLPSDLSKFCGAIAADADQCEGVVSTRTGKLTAAGANANGQYEVRSYSVMPSELVQRLGATSQSSQSLQTALSLAAQVSVATTAGADIGYLRQSDARAEALTRQPLVIGFAGSKRVDDDFSTTYFGWLFGPQFVLNGSADLALRHAVRNYGINADVSIPGWWNWIRLDISSAWVANWDSGDSVFGDGSHDKYASTVKHVNLPLTEGTYESLTSFIAATELGIQNSAIFASSVTPNVVPACASKVTLQIAGVNIWRADSVYLAGAKASSVNVLPDMNGITADFDMSAVLASLSNPEGGVQKIPLMVSAEQGSALPLYVYILGRIQSGNGTTTCQSPLFAPTTLKSLPPTTVFVKPTEVCSDAQRIVMTISGLNLMPNASPLRRLPVPTNARVDGEFYELEDDSLSVESTQIIANLKRREHTSAKVPLQTMSLVLRYDYTDPDAPMQAPPHKAALPFSIAVKDCKTVAKDPVAKLVTTSVKKAKDQNVSLDVDVPEGYADLVISLRPSSSTNDLKWRDSDSIRNLKPGSQVEVASKFDLSDVASGPLDVKVKIRPTPDKDWTDIKADKALSLTAS